MNKEKRITELKERITHITRHLDRFNNIPVVITKTEMENERALLMEQLEELERIED